MITRLTWLLLLLVIASCGLIEDYPPTGGEELVPIVSYTYSTRESCSEGVCNLLLHSGTRYGYENNEWKKVEKLRSWKGTTPITPVISFDGTHEVVVIDYNASSIAFEFSFDPENLGEYEYEVEDGKMKTKLKIINSTGGLEHEVEIEIEEDEYALIEYNSFIGTILSKEFRFGEDSTTIQLQDPDTENLEDAYFDEDDSPDGTETSLILDVIDGSGEMPFFKFNISAIPAGQQIDNATICVVTSVSQTETVDVWRSANQTWKEEDLDGVCPNVFCDALRSMLTTKIVSTTFVGGPTTQMCTGNLHTNGVAVDYAAGNPNTTIVFNHTGNAANFYTLLSKEYNLVPANRPYLNITYSVAAAPSDSCSNCDGSANCQIECADNCNLTAAIDNGGFNITFNGTGRVLQTAPLTNFNYMFQPLTCNYSRNASLGVS